ncbi:hypothetical protein FRC19_003182 [Serendipita sp. 401]|nr:hypothetical protein FRC19_003182 [Serendipita sp. 401]
MKLSTGLIGLVALVAGARAAVITTTKPPAGTTTDSRRATSTSTSACVWPIQQWSQCGGLGWTGPSVCPNGGTCVYMNDYYSQCLYCLKTTSTTRYITPTSTK